MSNLRNNSVELQMNELARCGFIRLAFQRVDTDNRSLLTKRCVVTISDVNVAGSTEECVSSFGFLSRLRLRCFSGTVLAHGQKVRVYDVAYFQ